MRKLRGRHGFTLVETLAVFIIIGILAAVMTVAFQPSITKSQDTVCLANRTQLKRLYTVRMLEAPVSFDLYLKEMRNETNARCPLSGSYTLSKDVYGRYSVLCSVHNESDTQPARIMYAASDYTNLNDTTSANNAQNAAVMTQLLADLNGSLDEIKRYMTDNNKGFIDGVNYVLSALGISAMTKNDFKPYPGSVNTADKITSLFVKSDGYGYIVYSSGSVYKMTNETYRGNWGNFNNNENWFAAQKNNDISNPKYLGWEKIK